MARRHLDKAFALNPNDAEGLIVRSLLLTHQGEPEAAVTSAQAAIRRNPHHPDWYLGPLALAHFFAHNYGEAIRVREMIASGFPEHLASTAAAYALGGNLSMAEEVMKQFLQAYSSHWTEKPSARVFAYQHWVFKREEDANLMFNGLRKAGMPD